MNIIRSAMNKGVSATNGNVCFENGARIRSSAHLAVVGPRFAVGRRSARTRLRTLAPQTLLNISNYIKNAKLSKCGVKKAARGGKIRAPKDNREAFLSHLSII